MLAPHGEVSPNANPEPTAFLTEEARHDRSRASPSGLHAYLHDTAYDEMFAAAGADDRRPRVEHAPGGVQDFTHIMIALVRQLRVPCRYVSGYLYHRSNGPDRSAEDAMHAWVEAYLPGLGWVGFDPTNNVLTGDRHIRVAVGRDYADVPPTRGCSRGTVTASCAWRSRFTPRRRRLRSRA